MWIRQQPSAEGGRHGQPGVALLDCPAQDILRRLAVQQRVGSLSGRVWMTQPPAFPVVRVVKRGMLWEGEKNPFSWRRAGVSPIERTDSLLVQTRAKWPIPNELRMERPIVALRAAVDLIHELFPEAQLRSITSTYNCVGLIVASRRVWVDPEHLLKVLKDDGYRMLQRAEHAEAGDVVVYHDADGDLCHVAIVVAKNLAVAGENRDILTVLSKWGADGEYAHDATKLPLLLGRPAQYWTDRRWV
jgi:hypothetical protein